MVLQREVRIPIWGWAAPGEKIEVLFNGQKYTTLTGSDGKWSLPLHPMKAGGPYTMEIEGENHIQITDILIGDVWVCSGQSNMEFWMDRVKAKYAQAIASSANNAIRQFLVKQTYDFQSPADDVESDGWKEANPENVLQFTAVGYFFARSLYEQYHVPIGLILSSKGGTPAESWLSEEALKAFPHYYQEAVRLKDSSLVNSIITHDQQVLKVWNDRIKAEDRGLAHGTIPWSAQNHDDSSWDTMDMPNYWEKADMEDTDGVIWFRKEIELSSDMVTRDALLYLGHMADDDSTYFNGVKVGSTNSRYFLREYQIPHPLLHVGKNTIAVRVVNKSGPGGFIKDKPYQFVANGKSIFLEGIWKFKAGAIVPPQPKTTAFPYKPLGLYNAMIAPLTAYGIKGVIWYQGEANTNRAAEYRTLFPALIADWRRQWHQGNFPFLYVQLASYLPAVKEPAESQWAELREAQAMTLSVPKTGMAVAIDIGEWNDVHPANKEDVGKRLSLVAQKVAYKEKKSIYSGPLYQKKKIKGNQVVLSFTNIGSGLVARNGDTLGYFSVADKDGKFVWAHARIEGDKVIVWNDQISHPVHVRYAWADNPDGANLFNAEGLPASPFRTDRP